MNRLTSSITSIVLLIHAALGCCWHHAHARPAHDEPAFTTAACCDGRSHEMEHAGAPSALPVPPAAPHECPHEHEPADCSGDACRFMRPETADWDGWLADGTPAPLAIERQEVSDLTLSTAAAISSFQAAHAPRPPLQLLYCALLI